MRITGIMGESYKKGCKDNKNKVRVIGQIAKYNSLKYRTVKTNVLQNNIRKSVVIPGSYILNSQV